MSGRKRGKPTTVRYPSLPTFQIMTCDVGSICLVGEKGAIPLVPIVCDFHRNTVSSELCIVSQMQLVNRRVNRTPHQAPANCEVSLVAEPTTSGVVEECLVHNLKTTSPIQFWFEGASIPTFKSMPLFPASLHLKINIEIVTCVTSKPITLWEFKCIMIFFIYYS